MDDTGDTGHYFMAAPADAGKWAVYDSQTVYGPMTLPDLKKEWGQYARGVVYQCKALPVQDDWKLLKPTGVMHRPALPIRCGLVISHPQCISEFLDSKVISMRE